MSSTQEQLELQLSEKEELISALTEQLEQAAEQLDRHKRTGTNRGAIEGESQELSGESEKRNPRAVLLKVDRFVDNWNDVDGANAFHRIEDKLNAIQSLLSTRTSISGDVLLEVGDLEEGSGEDCPQVENDAWSSLKASLLDGEEPSFVEETIDQNEEACTADVVAEEIPFQYQPFEIPDLPDIIDFADADKTALQDAITERDIFIGSLMDEVQKTRDVSRIPMPEDWDALCDIPDEVRNRLEFLEAQLNEQLRFAEIHQSVKRAGLARRELQLEQMQLEFISRLKRAGIDPEEFELQSPSSAEEVDSDEGESEDPAEECRRSLWTNLFGG